VREEPVQVAHVRERDQRRREASSAGLVERTVLADEFGPAGSDVGVLVHVGEHLGERRRRQNRIGIQQQRVAGQLLRSAFPPEPGRAEPQVVSIGIATVPGGGNHLCPGIFAAHHLHTAVGGVVVHHDGAVAERSLARSDGAQAVTQFVTRVIVDDDDGEVQHGRSALTVPARRVALTIACRIVRKLSSAGDGKGAPRAGYAGASGRRRDSRTS